MPKLVQVSADTGGRNLIAVDEEGEIWRGEIKRDRSGGDYVEWNYIRSEFERR